MAVTDQQLYNLIQYSLLESADSGSTYLSGLYTVAEVVGRANYRLDLFNKLTNCIVNVSDHTLTANTRDQDLSSSIAPWIDVLEITITQVDTSQTIYSIPKGSQMEADSFVTDQVGSNAAVAYPYLYTLDAAPILSISLLPPPSSAAGTMTVFHTPKISNLPTTPNGTALLIPDDLTPFIKFGVLADLFGDNDEANDPMRQKVCEMIFQLGVEITKAWVSGSPMAQ